MSIEMENEMHNCKHVKDELMEIAFRGGIPMPDGLSDCPRCREELAALRGVLKLTGSAIHSVTPSEDFWSGYHARLQEHLEVQSDLKSQSSPQLSTPRWRKLFTASV